MSHLHDIIRPHHFDFDIRFTCISAFMLKTIHRSRIQRRVLSVVFAYDHLFSNLKSSFKLKPCRDF